MLRLIHICETNIIQEPKQNLGPGAIAAYIEDKKDVMWAKHMHKTLL